MTDISRTNPAELTMMAESFKAETTPTLVCPPPVMPEGGFTLIVPATAPVVVKSEDDPSGLFRSATVAIEEYHRKTQPADPGHPSSYLPHPEVQDRTVDNLRQVNDGLASKLAAATVANKALTDELSEVKALAYNREKTNIDLVDKFTEVKVERDTAEMTNQSLTNRVAELESANMSYAKTLDEFKAENGILRAMAQPNNRAVQLEHCTTQVKALESKAEKLRLEVEYMRTGRSKALESCSALSIKNNQLNQSNKQLRKTNKELLEKLDPHNHEAHVKNIQSIADGVKIKRLEAAIRGDKQELLDKVVSLEQQLSMCRDSVKQLAADKVSLQKAIANMEDVTQQEFKSLQSEHLLAKPNKYNAPTREYVSDLEASVTARDAMVANYQQEVIKLQQQHNDQQQLITTLQEANRKFHAMLETVDGRVLGLLTAPSLNLQVAGNHYKDQPIQPVTFIRANNVPYVEGNIIKYVSRHRVKNGLNDLKKAQHYLEMLMEDYA